MTDLYEALRAAMTPDGRVRLTRELLTAMHEEGEQRSRMDDAAQPNPLTEMRDRFLTATGRMREAESRAETAERELEGAEREADEQRERRKRAEIERDAAHERARVAERALAKVRDADVVDRSFYNLDRAAWSERAKRAESQLDEMRADRDSWRQQCEDARSDALRYGRERDEAQGEASAISRRLATARLSLRDLVAHARACLDPEIVSRDPAHARLAALVERIDGGR